MRTIADKQLEQRKKYKTQKNTYKMFPVGTKVQIICVNQDLVTFSGEETGVVIENHKRYLGIIVKFDKPYDKYHKTWNFDPDDLIVIKPPNTSPNTTSDDKDAERWRTGGYTMTTTTIVAPSELKVGQKIKTTTSDKLDEILRSLKCIACDGSGAYQTNEEGDVDQCQYCWEIRFPFFESAKLQLLAYFKTEMNKLLPEENKPNGSSTDPIRHGGNAVIRKIRESLDKWGSK